MCANVIDLSGGQNIAHDVTQDCLSIQSKSYNISFIMLIIFIVVAAIAAAIFTKFALAREFEFSHIKV